MPSIHSFSLAENAVLCLLHLADRPFPVSSLVSAGAAIVGRAARRSDLSAAVSTLAVKGLIRRQGAAVRLAAPLREELARAVENAVEADGACSLFDSRVLAAFPVPDEAGPPGWMSLGDEADRIAIALLAEDYARDRPETFDRHRDEWLRHRAPFNPYADSVALSVRLVEALYGTPRMPADAPLRPAFAQALLPAVLLRSFLRGEPAEARLEEATALYETMSKPDDGAVEGIVVLVALLLWAGDLPRLRRLQTLADTFPDNYYLRDGRHAIANAARYVDSFFDGKATRTGAFDRFARYRHVLRDVSDERPPLSVLRLPALLLVPLVSAATKRWPTASASFSAATHFALREPESPARLLSSLLSNWFSRVWDESSVRGVLARATAQGHPLPPAVALAAALAIDEFDPHREQAAEYDPAPFLASALAAEKAGWRFLAANLAGAVRWHEALAEKADALLERLARAGVRPLLRTEPPAPRWQAALDALAAVWGEDGGEAVAQADARPNRFEWRLYAEGVPGRPDLYALRSLVVRYQKRLPRGDWSPGRTFGTTELRTFGRHGETISAADAAVRDALLSQPEPFYDEWSPFVATRSAAAPLRALAGHPDLTVSTREPEGKRRTPFRPAALEVEPVPFALRRKKDGSLVLSTALADLALPEELRDRFLLRRVGRDRFAVQLPDEASGALARVLRDQGDGASLRIAPEGAARAQRLLGGASLAGRIRLEGDASPATLPEVRGDPVPVARLAWRGASLELALRVRPAPGRGLLLPPGEGAAARTVLPEDGAAPDSPEAAPVRLVRDLAEESRRAAPVRAALEPYAAARADGSAFWRFEDDLEALEALDALHALGEETVRLEWRDGSPAPQVARLVSSSLRGGEGADRWFELSGSLAFDDGRVVDFLDLLSRLPERGGRYVRLDEGRYVRLTDALRRRLDALAAGGRAEGGSLRLAPAALLPLAQENVDAEADAALALPPALAVRASELRKRLAAPVPPPAGLRATLRPYQAEGYAWLSRLARCGLGACLADDMGLGKTLQLTALLVERAAEGPSLVLAPSSVVGNWASELRRFAPMLRPLFAADVAASGAAATPPLGPGDVVLASYGLLVSRPEFFESAAWNVLALDEAQAVKNHATQRARAVRRLRAAVRVAATGTPVENRLSEFWSLFDFLNPGLLGSHESFLRRYVAGDRATAALKRLAAPLVLRRLKGDVLRDLPAKTEVTLRVPLGAAEASAYEACRRKALDALAGASRPEDRMRILAELTRLRRFCCHPSLAIPEFPASAKLDAFLELVAELREGGHRALVFSQFTDCLAILRERLAERDVECLYLDGATPPRERTRLVERFQRGEGGDLFLISLKAGGTGLNLTAADYVVLYDPWWNPAVENQAADRAHRIGQTRPVTVYRLVAEGTVEEKVLALHEQKRALAEDLLEGAGSSALSPEQLLALFDR